MSETYRPRDDFERGDVQSLLKRMDELIRAFSKIVPSDFVSRTTGPSKSDPDAATQGNTGGDEDAPRGKSRRPRRRPEPESPTAPASPYELAKILGVNLGGGREGRSRDLSPSPPSTFFVNPSRADQSPGSWSNPIDVTPVGSSPSPRALPAPGSNLPSPIGPSPVDMALNPGRLDRIANDFVDTVLDVIDIKQRMSSASFMAGKGGSGGGPGSNPWGAGPNGPWGPFSATNYRANAGGGASGGGSGGGGGTGTPGAGSSPGGKKNPFGGGAWSWFRRAASKATSGAKAGSARSGGAWSWAKHGKRAWRGWSGPKFRAGYRAAYGAARFAGLGTAAAGTAASAATGVGLAVAAAKAIYDVAQELRASSEKQFQTGRRLAAYNGELAATFAGVDIQEGFRNRQLAGGTAATYRTLAGVVNMNRQSQVGIDTFGTNVANRFAIAGGAAASGVLYLSSEILKKFDSVLNRWDPGGKGLESVATNMYRGLFATLDAMLGYKQGDPNSWLGGYDKQLKDAQKMGNLFEYTDFLKEAKDMKPLRASLQIKL